jgi:hypothetical protein
MVLAVRPVEDKRIGVLWRARAEHLPQAIQESLDDVYRIRLWIDCVG